MIIFLPFGSQYGNVDDGWSILRKMGFIAYGLRFFEVSGQNGHLPAFWNFDIGGLAKVAKI